MSRPKIDNRTPAELADDAWETAKSLERCAVSRHAAATVLRKCADMLRKLAGPTPDEDDEKDDRPIAEFQDDVRDTLIEGLRELGIKNADQIDGGGCDSGDWRDFTLAEIRQAFVILSDRDYDRGYAEEEARLKAADDKLLAGPTNVVDAAAVVAHYEASLDRCGPHADRVQVMRDALAAVGAR